MQRKRPLESLLTPAATHGSGIAVNGNHIDAESPSPSSKRFATDVNDHPVPLVSNAGESEMHFVCQEIQSEIAFLKKHPDVAQRIPHAVRLLEKKCLKLNNSIDPELLEVDINKSMKKKTLISNAEKENEAELRSNAAGIAIRRPIRHYRGRGNAVVNSPSMVHEADSVVCYEPDFSNPVNQSAGPNRVLTPRAAELLRQKAEKKEEQRKAKEEKLRLADEKKSLQEEEKRKAESMRIDKFCVKQVKPQRKVMPAPSDHWLFSAFEIKEKMTLAPSHRRPPLSLEQKRNLMKIQIIKSDYLQKVTPRAVTKVKSLKPKLFQFDDSSYRPPYYGTWRKRSKIVNGRRPFAKDTDLDYDYESDEEWVEEEGDECKTEEEEEEGDEEENDEEDDGFFVEHGYLSSDEGDSEEKLPNESEEDRTRRLKERAEEWKIEQKAKQRRNHIKKLIANEYGPCFNAPGDEVQDMIKKNLFVGILLRYIN